VRDFIYSVMTDYPTLVIFLHVMSAVIWIGGLIALWFVSQKADEDIAIYETRAEFIRKYFLFLVPVVVVTFSTAMIMGFGYLDNAYDPDGFIVDMKNVDAFKLIKLKGSIFGAIVLDMMLMVYTIRNVKCGRASLRASHECLWLIHKYLLPIAIVLGTVNIFIGAYLRNLY